MADSLMERAFAGCFRPGRICLLGARSMPKYNRLSKDDAALLLIDHQSGLISLVQDFSPGEFKNNVLALGDIGKFLTCRQF